MRISYRSALFLLFVSSITVVISTGRIWAKVWYEDPGLPVVSLSLTGRQLDPLLSGLGIAAVASVVGILASRKLLRRIIGALVVLMGMGIVYSALSIHTRIRSLIEPLVSDAVGREITNFEFTFNSMYWLATVGGLGVIISGMLFALTNYEGSRMSPKYDRAKPVESELSPWQALDKGIDPTLNDLIG